VPVTPSRHLPLAAAPHHNHGLFSDHYLDQIAPRLMEWQLLVVEARPIMARMQEILRDYVPSANEAQTEEGLIKPILTALGHTYEVQAPLATPGTAKKPDYILYRDAAALNARKGQTLTEEVLQGAALAVGDAKYWDRPLDSPLRGGGDPFTNKNPSYQIAFYMQHSGLEWGILTNGRLWRLYHRETAHKLDRYYEVDLPALLEGGDSERFLYFYAFFRRDAFEAGPLSLAAILQQSTAYARGVGESLKTQVYQALRHLAQGFLDYPTNGLQPDAATLAQIYDHALIVLYRLLFILYAEARELLPVQESEDYRETYGLYAIKRSVADGLTRRRALLSTSALLWPRLQELFGIINAGSPPLHVATFNGGLFDPVRYPFLERYTVGDARLQDAIDMLARVDGQFVDYRDLAERHLGTIYEGLLEFHLHAIPPEGQWTVALLNERGERHSTGSYYTPDFIVAYLVEETLGPVLDAAIETAEDDNAKIQAILAVNVLDPAMGSGHFLVEATEYIARFLVSLDVPAETAAGAESDVAYWRRRVVQSCIYGVDLNPLAVELAKLSLWLATVARDRPLSFLDHHLRTGNSLVGAWLTDLPGQTSGSTRSRRRQAAPDQLALFADDAFRRSMSTAVSSMWLVEASPAQTVAEIKEQEQLYADLRRELTDRYGRLAGLVTATRFGLEIDPALWTPLADVAMGRSLAVVPRFAHWLDAAATLAARHHFFHWELEFPEVFFDRHGQSAGEQAGFDVVIGNPPYVRQEGLAGLKPYFVGAYATIYAGTADLFVYFFGQGLRLLRHGGRLSYISSNSWLRANYATALRSVLRQTSTVETLIDLGDNRVFADAPDLYPAIHVVRRESPPPDHTAKVAVFTRGEGLQGFARRVATKLAPLSIYDQPDSGWQLGDAASRTLFAKLMAGGRPLGEVVNGQMYRGVLTGLNEAFIVDQATRDRLIKADPTCSAILKPMLRGEDLRPWYQEDEGRWLIVLPSGWTRATLGEDLDEGPAWTQLCTRYPALAEHLYPFAGAARKRQDKGKYWWELRACDYYPAFDKPKILWPDITKIPRFSWDESGLYLGNTGYIMPTDQLWLLGFLASRCAWFLISRSAVGLGERAGLNRYRLIDQYMRPLPVPNPLPGERDAIGTLARELSVLARERYEVHRKMRHRLQVDLGTQETGPNNKLTAWWDLDFPALRAEVRKVWKRDIPLAERDDWESLLSSRRAEHTRLTEQIVQTEGLLNGRVYALFALTPGEVLLIEQSTQYRYGEI